MISPDTSGEIFTSVSGCTLPEALTFSTMVAGPAVAAVTSMPAGLPSQPFFLATDDTRIRTAFEHAAEAGLKYTFQSVGNASTLHPNTIKLTLTGPDGHQVEVIGQSRGGGVIRIVEVDGFGCDFSGSLHTLIIDALDVPGSIAFIASVIAHDDCNIATMFVSRKGKNEAARQFIEMDSPIKPLTLSYLRELRWVQHITYIPTLE